MRHICPSASIGMLVEKCFNLWVEAKTPKKLCWVLNEKIHPKYKTQDKKKPCLANPIEENSRNDVLGGLGCHCCADVEGGMDIRFPLCIRTDR